MEQGEGKQKVFGMAGLTIAKSQRGSVRRER
jgi:hypothetical protein